MIELLILLFFFKSEESYFLSSLDTIIQKKHLVPEATELWAPIPSIVDPGDNFSDAPSDAIILFDGNNLNSWTHKDGGEPKWTISDGYFTVKPGTGSIISKQYFGSCQLHIEFMTPSEIISQGQGRGNSGVYFMEDPNQQGDSGYEIQVLDSYNNRTYSNGQAGSVYKQHIPLVNASKKPGDWQSYDIIFKAPVFNDNGSVESHAYVTVFHNGVLIQNNVQIQGYVKFIGYPEYKAHPKKLPIKLQDHGNLVSFRNIWIREL
tara:strand:- start:528 stop:1313 length:786 start_codon:yes stop_codon:yes gene_type:complete